MNSSYTIDRLRAEDVDDVAAFFHQDLEELGDPVPLDALRALLVDVLADTSATSRCWVAREQTGEPLGAVLVNLISSVKLGGRAIWIEELYVPNQHRRRGLGRALVEAVLDWAEAEGLRGVDLEAYQGNTPAAILYRSLGFRRLGRERFCLDLDARDD